MRIGLLLPSLDAGGAQRQFVQLALGLSGRGHQVVFFTLVAGGRHWDDLARHTGVRLLALNDRRQQGRIALGHRLPTTVLHLRRLLCSEQPDVLYSALHIANLLGLLATDGGQRIPVVWGFRASYQSLPWRRRLPFELCRLLSGRPDLLIANSESGLRAHRQLGFSNPRTTVIANGIDTAEFRPDPDARDALRAEWGIARETVLVGIVGRLAPVKDHGTFLLAADCLAKICPDTRFICVGDGTSAQRALLDTAALETSLGTRLLWVGERRDMARVYNALDVLCLTSISEAFPNVLAEAMACGVGCVSTDVGDAAAIMGETGEIVPVGNAQAVAHAANRIMHRTDSERYRAGIAARQRILDHYSLDTMMDRTEQAMRTVAEARAWSALAPIRHNKGQLS